MQSNIPPAPVSKAALWLGWIISGLVALALLASGAGKLIKPPDAVKMMETLGWDESFFLALAICEIACALIYAFPRTAVLGAILVTGYFGGAVATHVRVSDFKDMTPAIILAVLAWCGLWLRDTRVRALAPWRSL